MSAWEKPDHTFQEWLTALEDYARRRGYSGLEPYALDGGLEYYRQAWEWGIEPNEIYEHDQPIPEDGEMKICRSLGQTRSNHRE